MKKEYSRGEAICTIAKAYGTESGDDRMSATTNDDNLARAIAELRNDPLRGLLLRRGHYILVSKATGEWVSSPTASEDDRLWSVPVREALRS